MLDSAPSGCFLSCIRDGVFLDHWRNASSGLAWLCSYLTVVRGETRPGTDQEKGHGNIAVDCVRALARYTGPRGMSKRLASIVRRSPCYPFHGSPRDSFVRENPLPTKFNIHPAAQYVLEQHQKGAQSENLRASYRRNSWHREENSFAIEARRLFSMQFDEPSDRKRRARDEQIERTRTAYVASNMDKSLYFHNIRTFTLFSDRALCLS